jgi:type VI secretion system protein ImpH
VAQPEHGLEYYRLVQLLLRGVLQPGGQAPAARGPRIAFRCDRSRAFPGREVSRVDCDRADGTVVVTTPDYCIDGMLGPLPEAYAEWVRRLERDGRAALGDFLDLFSTQVHRLRFALKAARAPALHPGPPEEADVVAQARGLAGLDGGQGECGLPLDDLRDFRGMWPMRRRSAPVLAGMLGHAVQAPLAVDEFAGGWLRPDPRHHARLGRTGGPRLGRDAAIGTRAWDPHKAVTLRIQPAGFAQLLTLLPGGAAFARLADTFRLATQRELDARVELRARAEDVPLLPLRARPGSRSRGPRLGWTAWLRSRRGPGECRAAFTLPAFAPGGCE